jgi:predicted nucleic acid-binding protein
VRGRGASALDFDQPTDHELRRERLEVERRRELVGERERALLLGRSDELGGGVDEDRSLRPRGGAERPRFGQPDRSHTGDLLAAGTHAPLRSNDAIHLAVAFRVGTDEIVTYDGELIERATAAGLPVLSPQAG